MTPEQRLGRIAAWAADEASVSGVIVVGFRARTSASYPAEAERRVRELVSQTLG
jgi:hypothetical protein